MALFQSNFFSFAGQKERLSNVVQTVKAAVTGKGVQSNTGVGAVDKVLSTAASNPFVTAGVVAAGVSAAGYAPTATGSLAKSEGTTLIQGAVQSAKNAITRTAAGSAATGGAATIASNTGSNVAKTAIIAGGAGIAAGYILSGQPSSQSSASTSQNPSFNPDQKQSGSQTIEQQPFQDNSQNSFDTQNTSNYNYGAGSIYSGSSQTPSFSSYPEQSTSANPLFDQDAGFSAEQETAADTGASATSSGSNGLVTAAIVLGAFYLLSKN